MKLTKRGKRVRSVFLIIAIGVGLYLAVLVGTHFWWTTAGFCWGSADKCLAGGL